MKVSSCTFLLRSLQRISRTLRVKSTVLLQSTRLSPHLAHSLPLSRLSPEITPLWLHSHPCWFLHTSNKQLVQRSLWACYSLWLECSCPTCPDIHNCFRSLLQQYSVSTVHALATLFKITTTHFYIIYCTYRIWPIIYLTKVLFTISPDRMKTSKGQVLLFPFIAISLVPTMVPGNMVDT